MVWRLPRVARRLPGVAQRLGGLAIRVTTDTPRKPAVRQRGGLYSAEIRDTDTGRTWYCPHKHLTLASARRCAGDMERRIGRFGWELATRQHKTGGRRPGARS